MQGEVCKFESFRTLHATRKQAMTAIVRLVKAAAVINLGLVIIEY